MKIDSIHRQQNELTVRNEALRSVGEPGRAAEAARAERSSTGAADTASLGRRYGRRGHINRFDAARGRAVDTRI